jgi:TRAP-type C4-dicarboxylate transport system permease small subunit
VANFTNNIAMISLALMMFLTTADVFFRYVFNRPIPGVYEYTECMMCVLASFSFAYVQVHKGHVNADLFIYKLSHRVQGIIDSIGYFLCAFVTFLIAYQAFLAALAVKKSGEVMAILPIPVYLFMYVFVFGTALLGVVFIVDLFEYMVGAAKNE